MKTRVYEHPVYYLRWVPDVWLGNTCGLKIYLTTLLTAVGKYCIDDGMVLQRCTKNGTNPAISKKESAVIMKNGIMTV